MTARSAEKRPLAKTARPKRVVIDNIAYDKCPYRGCGFLARDWGYNPSTGMRTEMLNGGVEMADHMRDVHGFIWMRVGKKAGWWHTSKFHPREQAP